MLWVSGDSFGLNLILACDILFVRFYGLSMKNGEGGWKRERNVGKERDKEAN